MLALTVKQPWAWAIIHAGKDVENRSWSTTHRGPLLIHAGKRIDPNGLERLAELGIALPDDLALGGIVGSVELVSCTFDASRSPWAVAGAWHWQLASPRALAFEPVRGQQCLFNVGPRPQQSFF